jgi:hypothetical protein
MEPTARRETHLAPATAAARFAAARRLLLRGFRWHAGAMLALNVLLTGLNILIGGSWWAFWPLFFTGALLAVHYFFYKATAADERWVTERVEELNLKSYDRSHIEDLKSRYGGGDDRRDR